MGVNKVKMGLGFDEEQLVGWDKVRFGRADSVHCPFITRNLYKQRS